MAEHYSFFDPVEVDGVYDREYNAQEFTDYFGALITTGVMKGAFNMLAVTANGSNMVTSVNTGIAFVEAKRYFNDAPLTFTHDTETIGLSRIDRIVVRMDQNVESRYVRAFIKKGTASTNPIPPTLTQNNTVYEISLAQVRIVGGQTFIASNAVTDERGKDVICPWAGSNILPSFDDNALSAHINDKASASNYGHVKIGSGLSVSNGLISANIPTIQDASTTQSGIVQLNNTLTSTSTTQAATADTVRYLNINKANSSSENYRSATLSNGWSGTVEYFKDGVGVVHVHADISGGTKALGTVAFTLPTGYRPNSTIVTTLNTYDFLDTAYGAIPVWMQTSGQLVLRKTVKDSLIGYFAFRAS